MKTPLFLLAFGLLLLPAALPTASAIDAPIYAVGDADLWVSIGGSTCVDHQNAKIVANVDASGSTMRSFTLTTGEVLITDDGTNAVYTSTGTGNCKSASFPIVVNAINCVAGTAHMEAYTTGGGAVSFDATIQCSYGACLEYHPEALTNACVEVGVGTGTVATPTATPGSTTIYLPSATTVPTPVCVIGPVCVTVPLPTGVNPAGTPETIPWATIGWTDTTIPEPVVSGYVEVTVLCGHVPQSVCHVDL